MAVIPPLCPLDEDEFKRRWDAGARTMDELDPEFMVWRRRCQRNLVFLVCGNVLLVAATYALLTMILNAG